MKLQGWNRHEEKQKQKIKVYFCCERETEVLNDCMWTTLHVLFFNFNRSKPLIISDGKILVVHL
jgi:hypothetical protein